MNGAEERQGRGGADGRSRKNCIWVEKGPEVRWDLELVAGREGGAGNMDVA